MKQCLVFGTSSQSWSSDSLSEVHLLLVRLYLEGRVNHQILRNLDSWRENLIEIENISFSSY